MGGGLEYPWREAVAGALDWWRDAGVDTLVEDAPRDWLGRAPVRAPEAQPAEAVPETLEAFLAWRLSDAAPEAAWPSPRIAPIGGTGAALMVLLDMPETSDAETRLLLSGPEGRLLDRMLAAIGHSRATAHLATIAMARPLSGAIASEIEPRLFELARRHVEIAKPGQLLLMGAIANRAILGRESLNLGKLQYSDVNGISVTTVASLHPRLLLDQPAKKAEAWKHLQSLMGDIGL